LQREFLGNLSEGCEVVYGEWDLVVYECLNGYNKVYEYL
jgi:hypothetical protein